MHCLRGQSERSPVRTCLPRLSYHLAVTDENEHIERHLLDVETVEVIEVSLHARS